MLGIDGARRHERDVVIVAIVFRLFLFSRAGGRGGFRDGRRGGGGGGGRGRGVSGGGGRGGGGSVGAVHAVATKLLPLSGAIGLGSARLT